MKFNHLEPFSEIDGVPVFLSRDRNKELAEYGYVMVFRSNTGKESVIFAKELFELCDEGMIRPLIAHRLVSGKVNHAKMTNVTDNLSQVSQADREVALIFGISSAMKIILFDYNHGRKYLWRQPMGTLNKLVSQASMAIFETKRLGRLLFTYFR